MLRGAEIRQDAIKYLKDVGATDIKVKYGGKHEHLLYTLNGEKCMHVLPHKNPSDNMAGDKFMADIRRDVRRCMGEDREDENIMQKVVKLSIVSAVNRNKPPVVLRVMMNDAAYEALNSNKSDFARIHFDEKNREVVLKTISHDGSKLVRMNNPGTSDHAMKWYVGTQKIPDWMNKTKTKSMEIQSVKWSHNELRVPLPEHLINDYELQENWTNRKPIKSPRTESTVRAASSAPVTTQNKATSPDVYSEGRTIVQLMNDWLKDQHKKGNEISIEQFQNEDGAQQIKAKIRVVTIVEEEL